MANNLLVSFDLHGSDRQSVPIFDAIEELGHATRLLSSTWYVRSNLRAPDAARRVWAVMDPVDALLVVDASGGEAAMFNLDESCVRFMSLCWHLQIEAANPLSSASAADGMLTASCSVRPRAQHVG